MAPIVGAARRPAGTVGEVARRGREAATPRGSEAAARGRDVLFHLHNLRDVHGVHLAAGHARPPVEPGANSAIPSYGGVCTYGRRCRPPCRCIARSAGHLAQGARRAHCGGSLSPRLAPDRHRVGGRRGERHRGRWSRRAVRRRHRGGARRAVTRAVAGGTAGRRQAPSRRAAPRAVVTRAAGGPSRRQRRHRGRPHRGRRHGGRRGERHRGRPSPRPSPRAAVAASGTAGGGHGGPSRRGRHRTGTGGHRPARRPRSKAAASAHSLPRCPRSRRRTPVRNGGRAPGPGGRAPDRLRRE